MAEIDPESVFPSERVLNAVLDGDITQLTRGQQYADAGDTFEIDGRAFEIVAVEDRTLGDLTDEDARAEGSADLEAYRDRLVRAHGGDFEWNDDADVVTHRVEPAEEV